MDGLKSASHLSEQAEDLPRGEGLDAGPGIEGESVHPVDDEEGEEGSVGACPLSGVMKPGDMGVEDAREQLHL
jgi:hypothetical protein